MRVKLWRRILVPHDFSASANHAAAIARDHAMDYDGQITLLHVIDLPPHFGPDTTLVLPAGHETPIGIRRFAEEQGRAHVEDLAERLRKDGIPTTAHVRIGRPADEIVQFLEDQRAAGQPFDVVVMGTHGRTGLRHLVAGSVTERVVRISPVPVMTIRHLD